VPGAVEPVNLRIAIPAKDESEGFVQASPTLVVAAMLLSEVTGPGAVTAMYR
jgi:hypothetical protein